MRLTAITNLIQGHTLLDIGTDHAYVLIRALKEGRIQKGIAVEIAENPLKRAKSNAINHQVEKHITFILSDGFSNVNMDYDIVSITGLGFDTIKHILSQQHQLPNYYILSTHSKVIELRQFLSDNNFNIIDEVLVYDKRFYTIIVVKKEKQVLSAEDILLSPILRHRPSSIPYYEQELNKVNLIISKSTNKDKAALYYRKKTYEKVLKILKLENYYKKSN